MKSFSFSGSNFGPSRVFDGVVDAVLIRSYTFTSNCNVTFNNDSLITCQSPFPVVNGASYNVSITIGGITTTSSFATTVVGSNTASTSPITGSTSSKTSVVTGSASKQMFSTFLSLVIGLLVGFGYLCD